MHSPRVPVGSGGSVMRYRIHFALCIASTLTVCAGAQAQRRTQAVVISAPAGTRVIRSSQPAATFSPAPGGTLLVNGVPLSAVDVLAGGVSSLPNPGFDFTHHSAVNRNAGVRALIDPVTQHQLALARQIRRETPLVVPVAFPLVINNIQVNVTPQPPVVILQGVGGNGDADLEERVERLERAGYAVSGPRLESPARPATREDVPEPRELGEYVLMRQDGTVAFAVAFSVERERIVYITREGLRRALPLAELDAAATLEMNEQRGTTLRLPI